jgi:hypothetical protein
MSGDAPPARERPGITRCEDDAAAAASAVRG